MKSKAVKTMIIVLLIISAVSSLSWAQGRPGPRSMPPRGPHGRMIKPGDDPNELGPGRGPGLMLRQLDLTEEQQEKIKSIHETNQKAMQEAREAVQKAMQALRQAVEDEGDEETVNTAAAAVGKAMGQRAIMRIKSQKAVKAVLTEEQLKKMEELKEKAKACREAFGDDGPGGFRGERQQRHHPRRHRR